MSCSVNFRNSALRDWAKCHHGRGIYIAGWRQRYRAWLSPSARFSKHAPMSPLMKFNAHEVFTVDGYATNAERATSWDDIF